LAEPIQIAYLVSRYPTASHTFILREIAALREMGFDIRVVAIRGADRPPEQMTEAERREQASTFVVLPARAGFFLAHLLTLVRRPLGYLRGLATALDWGRWDLAALLHHLIYFAEAVQVGFEVERAGLRHIHSHFSSTVGVLAATVFSKDLSITIHGSDEFIDVAGFHMREKVARARFIVAISRYGASQIMRASDARDWDKIEVCPLGVDPSLFSPGPAREPAARLHVISVGRLASVKAYQILIGACRRLVSSGSDIRLHLVGSGPECERLEQCAAHAGIADRVVFEGTRNQDEVIALYRQSDIFALSSFAEGVPVVLMEAMALEIPCVSTWVTGIPELIRNGIDGLLVPPGDEEALAAALARLVSDRDLRRRLGKSGRERVLERYDLARNTAELGRIFRRRLA
jgi:glycosyltransferase involved in cell wall biosynthesis